MYKPFLVGQPDGLDSTEHWRTVYLYTRTGATPTSWPGVGVGHDIGGESGQDPKEYVSLVSGWLDTCLHSHPACPKNTAVPLPSRLLDVQSGQYDRAGGDSIRLVSTSGLTGSYTALSHCRGWPIDVRTTKHNIASHQAGVQFSNLPRNFQDAVTVTRAIGLRYLWIDVIQDDKTDWEVESGNMANVYHQAYFLIGANKGLCYAGKAVGVVEEEHAVVYARSTGCYLDHNLDLSPEGNLGSRGPLGLRAWTLQESLLASRLVTFEEPEIVWRCNKAAFCQCGNRDQLSVLSLQSVFSLNAILRGPVWSPERHMDWYRIVQEVARRKIRNSSDMLPCLSGLARQFHGAGAGSYLAGLWVKDLAMGLLWNAGQGHTGSTAITPYRGPSWSWTSIQDPLYDVLFSDQWDREPWGEGLSLYRVHIQLLKVECTPKGKDAFGEVSVGCSVTVAAPLMELRAHPECEDREKPSWIIHSMFGQDSVVTSYSWLHVHFDSRGYEQLRGAQIEQGTGGTWCLFLLFVGDLCRGQMSGQGLVLNRRPGLSGVTYERVGIFEFDAGVYDDDSKSLTQMIDSGNERGTAKII
ncbi:hypothetical protein V8F06_012926 [Rhypophila decipiens]